MNRNELIIHHANLTWDSLSVCLDQYGIRRGSEYTGLTVNDSVMLLSYTLNMIGVDKWKTLKGIKDELTQAAQLDDESHVRLSYTGMDYRIEVPKPIGLHKKVTINEIIQGSKGLRINLGLSAYDNKPVALDFTGNTAGHALVSGATRCGKTNILKLYLMSLIYRNSPDNMRVAIIDSVKAKGKYAAFQNSAHLATEILNTEKKATAFLTWVKDTIVKLGGRKMSKKIIIVIDEVLLLVENKIIKGLLSYVATAGAEVGFHLIAATQYTKADEIGGRQFKGNLMTRICGAVDDHHSSKNALGHNGAGAEGLMAPGDFLVAEQGRITRIAVPEMFDSDLKHIKRGMSPIMRLNWDNDDPGDIPVAKAPNIGTCFDKIDPRLLRLAIEGKHKSGRFFGPDVVRKASKVLANKGLGNSIGQGTAAEYVKFAKKYREIK